MNKVVSKKPVRIKNNTKYFNPAISKAFVCFSSPETDMSKRMKKEGYENRMYWQFRYCQDHDGQVYFYTLTYNDEHMPKYNIGYERDETKLPADLLAKPKSAWTREDYKRRGLLIGSCPWKAITMNCFDYEDLRDLLTGGFRKQLLRKFGTTFKYFIGAELGDGKGERGMHNNPHYHVLFFLENANNPRYPYVKILPEQFRYLVKKYWQGFDENIDGPRDYRTAKYGIAKEGDYVGLVRDFHAISYVSKYVVKDAKLRMHEHDIARNLVFKYKAELQYDDDFCHGFWRDVVYPMYNFPTDSRHKCWYYCDEDLIHRLLGDEYVIDYYPDFLDGGICWHHVVVDAIKKCNLWKEYTDYRRHCVEDKVRLGINEYRNRYCNKCRCSQGLGLYALDFIDLENPTIQVATNKGFVNRPLSMYYYRKLFTDVVKDKKGSNIRILNDLGIDYKCTQLPKQIDKKMKVATSFLDLVVGDPDLFEKMKNSEENISVSFTYDDFLRNLNYLLDENNNIEDIVKHYAEYKLIYEDRYFQLKTDGDSECCYFPDIDPIMDYRRFIQPSIFTCSRSDLRLSAFLDCPPKDWLAYISHPYFLRYHCVFSVLDLCADYFFVQGDNKRQKEAEERAAVKRFHDQRKLKDFYAFFK